MNDRLNPQIIMAHDVESGHTTIAPAIEWLMNDHWQFTLRANVKIDDGVSTWDDNRSSIPYPGLSAALTAGATTAVAQFIVAPDGSVTACLIPTVIESHGHPVIQVDYQGLCRWE